MNMKKKEFSNPKKNGLHSDKCSSKFNSKSNFSVQIENSKSKDKKATKININNNNNSKPHKEGDKQEIKNNKKLIDTVKHAASSRNKVNNTTTQCQSTHNTYAYLMIYESAINNIFKFIKTTFDEYTYETLKTEFIKQISNSITNYEANSNVKELNPNNDNSPTNITVETNLLIENFLKNKKKPGKEETMTNLIISLDLNAINDNQNSKRKHSVNIGSKSNSKTNTNNNNNLINKQRPESTKSAKNKHKSNLSPKDNNNVHLSNILNQKHSLYTLTKSQKSKPNKTFSGSKSKSTSSERGLKNNLLKKDKVNEPKVKNLNNLNIKSSSTLTTKNAFNSTNMKKDFKSSPLVHNIKSIYTKNNKNNQPKKATSNLYSNVNTVSSSNANEKKNSSLSNSYQHKHFEKVANTATNTNTKRNGNNKISKNPTVQSMERKINGYSESKVKKKIKENAQIKITQIITNDSISKKTDKQNEMSKSNILRTDEQMKEIKSGLDENLKVMFNFSYEGFLNKESESESKKSFADNFRNISEENILKADSQGEP